MAKSQFDVLKEEFHNECKVINLKYEYSGIGRAKLYEITNREDCSFVLWIGNRRVIKRKAFEEYMEKAYSI